MHACFSLFDVSSFKTNPIQRKKAKSKKHNKKKSKEKRVKKRVNLDLGQIRDPNNDPERAIFTFREKKKFFGVN